MTDAISHILALVDARDDARLAQRTAIQLAAAPGALVTLLLVDEGDSRLAATAQLDAISNLHEVMLTPATATSAAPGCSDELWQQAIERVSAMRDELELNSPEPLQIRVVCRRGDAIAETRAFIDEAGVDIVVAPAPRSWDSRVLRRLVRSLERCCACQLQVVHPPFAERLNRRSAWRRWWTSLAARWGLGAAARDLEGVPAGDA